MNTSIKFQGAEYASVEAMPPDVRAAYQAILQDPDMYELYQLEQQEQASADGAAPERAWGGPRAAGGVPVPAQFDQVTSLGPAAEVFEHAGLKLLPNFGTPHVTALVRYRDGVAYQTGGKDVHTLLWDEVAVIQSDIISASHGSTARHEYTLTKTNGEKLILDDGLKDVGVALDSIKGNAFSRLAPPLAQRYQAGEALTFGPVTIQRQNGLQMDGKLYAWNTIQDIKVEYGRLKLTMRDGKKHETRVSVIPNVELLCQLIGLDTFDLRLGYS